MDIYITIRNTKAHFSMMTAQTPALSKVKYHELPYIDYSRSPEHIGDESRNFSVHLFKTDKDG